MIDAGWVPVKVDATGGYVRFGITEGRLRVHPDDEGELVVAALAGSEVNAWQRETGRAVAGGYVTGLEALSDTIGLWTVRTPDGLTMKNPDRRTPWLVNYGRDIDGHRAERFSPPALLAEWWRRDLLADGMLAPGACRYRCELVNRTVEKLRAARLCRQLFVSTGPVLPHPAALPTVVLDVLAGDPDPDLRVQLVRNHATRPGLLGRLSGDADREVRRAVREARSAP